jgi:hypothetical protein
MKVSIKFKEVVTHDSWGFVKSNVWPRIKYMRLILYSAFCFMVKEQTLKIGCIFYYAKKFMHNYCIFDIKHPGKNISYFYQINFSDFQGHQTGVGTSEIFFGSDRDRINACIHIFAHICVYHPSRSTLKYLCWKLFQIKP